MSYKPIYPPEGQPCLGFACCCCLNVSYDAIREKFEPCRKVTKTERGMKMHLLRVHGIRMQGELFAATEEQVAR